MSKRGEATAQDNREIIPQRQFEPVFNVGIAKSKFLNRRDTS
jgi:hypothetical protein